MKAGRILIIEKDEGLALKVVAALEEAGYTVVRAIDACEGLKKLYEGCPDLVILAGELLTVDGDDPCLRLRQSSYLPIIVIGSREYLVETLERGADAFITKPPNLSELVARVHGLLRRKPRHNPPGGNPKLEIENHLNNGGDGLSRLTDTESRLASCLILNKDRLLGYPQLITEVWGGKEVSFDTLHFYIRRLRKKLQAFSPNPINIINYRGVGYRFEEVIQPSG